MAGIQNIHTQPVLDLLNLDPRSRRMPVIDPQTLTWVYTLDPAWLNPQIVAGRDENSINGVTVSSRLTNIDQRGDVALDRADAQLIYCWYELGGTGTVTPLSIRVGMNAPNDTTGVILEEREVANPGSWALGPYFIPRGWDLLLTNTANGGAGDTSKFDAWGVQAENGVPLPALSGVNSTVGT